MKKIFFALAALTAPFGFSQTSPNVEWRNYSWIDHEYNPPYNYVDQRHSDYDWWYDHCTGYTNPSTKTGHLGYFACGVGKYRCAERSNSSAPPLKYDETVAAYGSYNDGCTIESAPLWRACSKDYDYANWENYISGALGLGFNQIGRINPDGSTNFVTTINYNGEYFRVKQLQDGSFLTVGSSAATRKRLSSPQNGTPLYYNPTTTNPNDYFKSSDIFDVNNPQRNSGHFNCYKFDANGNEVWDNIYGMNDFNAAGTFNYSYTDPSNNTTNYSHSGKQLAYFVGGLAFDFVQEPSGNIAVVGFNADYQDNLIGKACLIKLDNNGNVLGTKWLSSVIGKGSQARGIEFATIAGIDYYIIAVTQEGAANMDSQVDIYALQTNLASSPVLIHSFIPTSSTNKKATAWSLSVIGTNLYVPLITDATWVWWAGDNIGDLYCAKVDLTNFTPSTNLVASTFLHQVHAFDMKARSVVLSDGNIALVGATQTAAWNTICPSNPPPGYIMNNSAAPDYVSCGSQFAGQVTNWWNTDTYVAKVSPNTTKIWDKTFDSDTPFSCTDYPTSPTSGGGDPKRQECMYGISEAPDGGIVVSGNNSSNCDDNYMAKLYPDCNAQAAYDIKDPSNTITLTSNTTWNTPHKVIGKVVVPAGKILTIDGTTIEFADSKLTGIITNITVQVGGQLVIKNNAILTSIIACPNSMWDGVDVQGTSQKQIPANQGVVTMNTNATISNARIGLELGSVPTANIPVNGGYVRATNAKFINNYIDVQTYRYVAPMNILGNEPDNLTAFDGCQFIANNYLNDPTYVDAFGNRLITSVHVNLYEVKNVKFTNNLFKTDLSTLGPIYTTANRSTGIKAYAAPFITTPKCVAMDMYGNCVYGPSNNFENLRYGVYAESPNPMFNQFTVKKTNFLNCYSGIYHSGINYSKVEQNSYIVNTNIPSIGGKGCLFNPISCTNYFYYGTNSTGFSHQENVVKVVGNQQVKGSIFNACGTSANESYLNSYDNMNTGQQSQLTNGSTSPGMNGLQLKCNKNTNTKSWDIFKSSGVMGEQGACSGLDPKNPANNLFSHNSVPVASDINGSTGSGFTYRYNGNPPTGQQVPFYYSANIVPANCPGLPPFTYNSNTCPSKLINTSTSGSGNINSLTQRALDTKQTIDQISQPLIAGAASTLITAINSNMNPGDLKNLLIQYSPYLSDAVLIAYIQKAPPSGNLKDVVIANSPVTQPVKSEIDNLNLPNGIKNNINGAQTGVSARAQLEAEIAFYNYTKDITVNEIVRYYLEDSTVNQKEYVIKWLRWNNTIESKRDLIFAEMAAHHYTRAQDLIDSLNVVEQNPKYLQFVQACKDMYSAYQPWSVVQTNSTLMNKIEPVAEDSLSPYMANARTVIRFAYMKFSDQPDHNNSFGNEEAYQEDEEYEEYEHYPNYEVVEGFNQNSNSRFLIPQAQQDIKPSINNTSEINAIAYPNPFANQLTVAYTLAEQEGSSPIEVRLIEVGSGRIIRKTNSTKSADLITFNTDELAPGVYFINISRGSESLSNLKLVNIK